MKKEFKQDLSFGLHQQPIYKKYKYYKKHNLPV